MFNYKKIKEIRNKLDLELQILKLLLKFILKKSFRLRILMIKLHQFLHLLIQPMERLIYQKHKFVQLKMEASNMIRMAALY